MVMFSKTSTETITIKNLKLTLELVMSMKSFKCSGVLYIIVKYLKGAIY